MDINQRYHKINSMQDLQFIQQMLGFFQCRVIKDCKPLQFFELEYVIVKSSSVLVKETLKEKRKNPNKSIFCFYFDQNKQFVIMKFYNAWQIMKNILRAKHGEFLKRMKFWQEFKKQKNYYQNAFLSFLQNEKTDVQSLEIHVLCNQRNSSSIQDNYRTFQKSNIQKNISRHKQNLLHFYFSNGFKSPETFHFLYHQLKVMHQTASIIQQSKLFSNLMINDLQRKQTNLQIQFDRWKVYLLKNNEFNKQSCEDEDQNNQKKKIQNQKDEVQYQDL